MPLSKNRRKNGKKVLHNRAKRDRRLDKAMGEQPSALTLQDLINVLAWEESKKSDDDPTKMHNPNAAVADDAVIHISDEVPVTVGEGDDRRQVGVVAKIPGIDGHVSIEITDPVVLKQVQGPLNHLSIAEEEPQDGR